MAEPIIIGVDYGIDDRVAVVVMQSRPDGGWTLLDLVEECWLRPEKRETIVPLLLTYQPQT